VRIFDVHVRAPGDHRPHPLTPSSARRDNGGQQVGNMLPKRAEDPQILVEKL